MTASLSEALVAAMLRRRGAIDGAVRTKTVLHIADALGIARAACETSPLAAGVAAAFGPERAASEPARAFVRSAQIHILDFDDIHDLARVHPGAVTIPAALAVATPDTPGARIVEAVCLGNELLCRLGALWKPTGSGPGSEWFLTQLLGYFAAALAAGIVLELPASGLRSALGLAYMQAAGGKEAGFGTGGNARAIYPAFAAQGGVQAALLARVGVEGPPSALDGDAGFFRLYFGAELAPQQRERLLDTGGWVWTDTRIKPWPSCRHSHPYVAAAQQLRAGIDVADIEQVRVSVNRSSGRLCHPIELRRRPATLQDAKYSIPFMVAFSLVHDHVGLGNLGPAALQDDRVLALAQRVSTVDGMPDAPGLPEARLQLVMKDGATHRCDLALAHDLDAAAVRAKFMECLAYAGHGERSLQHWDDAMALDAASSAALLRLFTLHARGTAPAA